MGRHARIENACNFCYRKGRFKFYAVPNGRVCLVHLEMWFSLKLPQLLKGTVKA